MERLENLKFLFVILLFLIFLFSVRIFPNSVFWEEFFLKKYCAIELVSDRCMVSRLDRGVEVVPQLERIYIYKYVDKTYLYC